MQSVETVYSRLLLENEARLARERIRHLRYGVAKVGVFLAALLMALLLLHHPPYLFLLLFPALVVLVLALAHSRVVRRARHLTRVADFYRRGLARVQDRWAGTGSSGERFLDPAHPYARDLDLFGSGSLFELLSTPRTRAGEEVLAQWLLHPACKDEVESRQQAVLEIKERLSFRERLFAAGESLQPGLHPDELSAWGEAKPLFSSPGPALSLLALSLLWLAAFAWWLLSSALVFPESAWFSGAPWYGFIAISLVNYAISYRLERLILPSAANLEQAAEDLGVLAEVMEILEQETFTTPRLRSLRESLDPAGHGAPSRALRKLRRLLTYLENRRNWFARILNAVAFYNAHFALAAERWQRTFGPSIRGWLGCVGEFEALAALAAYAFEHPEDVFAEFTSVTPCLEAEGLAHPLLPSARAVRNDIALGPELQLVLISGPNMAGKSTLLRGIGLNAVLAQCGAPVRCRRLCLSPLAVGASICVLDSLQGGVSRFYAEIRRLKLLSDLARGPLPLLFLLDELLSGTNSHDRYDGTRFVVQSLVRRRAIGLVTTHDLALTALPDTLGGIARNFHFEDTVENGELRFDYRLRPGIVRTSNALKLMRSIGLEISDPPSASISSHPQPPRP